MQQQMLKHFMAYKCVRVGCLKGEYKKKKKKLFNHCMNFIFIIAGDAGIRTNSCL